MYIAAYIGGLRYSDSVNLLTLTMSANNSDLNTKDNKTGRHNVRLVYRRYCYHSDRQRRRVSTFYSHRYHIYKDLDLHIDRNKIVLVYTFSVTKPPLHVDVPFYLFYLHVSGQYIQSAFFIFSFSFLL